MSKGDLSLALIQSPGVMMRSRESRGVSETFLQRGQVMDERRSPPRFWRRGCLFSSSFGLPLSILSVLVMMRWGASVILLQCLFDLVKEYSHVLSRILLLGAMEKLGEFCMSSAKVPPKIARGVLRFLTA